MRTPYSYAFTKSKPKTLRSMPSDELEHFLSAIKARDSDTLSKFKQDKHFLTSALFYGIAQWEEVKVIEYLILAGAEVHALDEKRFSCLWRALQTRQLDTIKCLIKYGANHKVCRNPHNNSHLLYEAFLQHEAGYSEIFYFLWQFYSEYTEIQLAELLKDSEQTKTLARFRTNHPSLLSHTPESVKSLLSAGTAGPALKDLPIPLPRFSAPGLPAEWLAPLKKGSASLEKMADGLTRKDITPKIAPLRERFASKGEEKTHSGLKRKFNELSKIEDHTKLISPLNTKSFKFIKEGSDCSGDRDHYTPSPDSTTTALTTTEMECPSDSALSPKNDSIEVVASLIFRALVMAKEKGLLNLPCESRACSPTEQMLIDSETRLARGLATQPVTPVNSTTSSGYLS